MRFVVLGTSEFAASCSKGLIDGGAEILCYFSMTPALLPLNAFDMGALAKSQRVPFHESADMNSAESIEIVRSYAPDFLFTSWPKLLGAGVISSPIRMTIGTHPTELPYNRGRHPLHWLIAQGYSESRVSFFKMDAGVDNGNILLQPRFEFSPDHDINDLARLMNSTGYEGAKELAARLSRDPAWEGSPQRQSEANYWRARTPHDVTIDLRMNADLIIRTVRSFTRPYPCANLIFESNLIKIIEADVVEKELSADQLRRLEPGRIVEATGNILVAKAADRLVKLVSADSLPERLLAVKYVHPPTKYLLAFPEVLAKFAAVK